MNEELKENIQEYTWIFFLVTGFSFLLFVGMLRLLDGSSSSTLFRIGLISIGLGVLSFIKTKLRKKNTRRRTGSHSY